MLEAEREARRQNREGETQAIFRERFRDLSEKEGELADFEFRVRTFQKWFDGRFLKANSTRPKIRSYFLLTTRGRRRRIL